MHNEKYFEDLKALQEQIKEHLKNEQSQSFYDTWADTFEIEKIDKNCVVVGYHGSESLKRFKNECKDVLWFSICMFVGYKQKIKIVKRKLAKPTKQDKNIKKNFKAIKLLAIGLVFACISVSIGVVMCDYITNRNFRETFYSVSSLKVNNRIRVIQISDLHNCTYGKNNKNLIERVTKLQPDVIICTGDIIEPEDADISKIEHLGKELSTVAPLYYVYGNNEVESVYDFLLNKNELDKKFSFNDENRDETKLLELSDSLSEKLEKSGFKVLKNKKDTITIGTTNVDVYGVLTSNPSSFWPYGEKSFGNYLNEDSNNLKITAIHEPFIFEEFKSNEYWGDLMLCGHTHGGEVRVPILGPLYTREGGIFPERNDCYVYGRYDVAGRPLIVSSGLENNGILRINNQPELVIVDINKF